MATLGFLVVLTTTAVEAQHIECELPVHRHMTIQKVQQAVRTREQRFSVDTNTSALAYLAPHRFSFQIRHNSQVDSTGTLYDDGWRESAGDESQWSWRFDIEWDFSRLVFNPSLLAIARHRMETQRRTDNMVDLATRLYFERLAIHSEARTTTHEQCKARVHRFRVVDARLEAMLNFATDMPRKLEQVPIGSYTVEDAR